jgi:hypothetical protein
MGSSADQAGGAGKTLGKPRHFATISQSEQGASSPA